MQHANPIARTMAILVCVVTTSYAVSGQVIDFELVPTSSSTTAAPNEGDPISHQYFISPSNVIFSLVDSGFQSIGSPQIAKVGGPTFFAFDGPTTTYPTNCQQSAGDEWDMPDPSANVGCYFLTDDGNNTNGNAETLFVEYGVGVQASSGEILDVDGNEAWTVVAYDTTFVTGINSPAPIATWRVCAAGALNLPDVFGNLGCDETTDIGDGWPTKFTISTNDINRPIRSIAIVFDGLPATGGGGVGLAFDNFSPDAPQPPLPCDGGSGTVDCCDCEISACNQTCCAASDHCHIAEHSDSDDLLRLTVMAFLGFIFMLLLVLVLRTERR